jgi:MraZ protein
VFLGTYTPRLDDKGRLVMPAKYRGDLEGGVVITRGQERCLYVFTRDEFRSRTESLSAAPMSSRRNRGVMRMIGALAHDEVPDKQGRLSIPAGLREYAGLDRDVAVVGALSKFEIWSLPAWEDYQRENEESFSSWDEEVADLF